MVTSNKDHRLIFLCILISGLLCVGHVTVNRLIVTLSIALYLGCVVLTSMNGKVLYFLCFFIPWAPLMKFEPGTMSFYTIGLIGACLLTWIRYRISIQRYVAPAIALLALLFTVRTLYGHGIDNSFIMFGIMLLALPMMGWDLHKTYDFYYLNLFYSIGIITAALSAYYLVPYSSIAKFIDVYSFNEITRYSGYYGDSNFYSAQIAAALAGLLVIFITLRKRMWLSIFISFVLIYCGLLSASKSFVITAAVVILLWILQVLSLRGNMSYKVTIIVSIAAVVIGILASNVFTSLIDIVAIRFGNSTNISDVTTGRSDIWMNYLRYLEKNPKVLLFGQGYTSALVDERASHNTILQCVFQFGLVGFPIFLIWLSRIFEISMRQIKIKQSQYLLCLILVLGVALPWMGIDLLFFDEFFLMMFYISLGFKWICEHSNELSGIDENVCTAQDM